MQDENNSDVVGNASESKEQTTILLAEDDRFVSDIYKRKLTLDGYRVLHAQDGREALRFMDQEVPDLVLLDIMMPVIDGMEVLEKMKGDARLKKIPIIMLTNLAEKEHIERSTSLGANGYIVKAHFTPSEVTAKVREVLEKQK